MNRVGELLCELDEVEVTVPRTLVMAEEGSSGEHRGTYSGPEAATIYGLLRERYDPKVGLEPREDEYRLQFKTVSNTVVGRYTIDRSSAPDIEQVLIPEEDESLGDDAAEDGLKEYLDGLQREPVVGDLFYADEGTVEALTDSEKDHVQYGDGVVKIAASAFDDTEPYTRSLFNRNGTRKAHDLLQEYGDWTVEIVEAEKGGADGAPV